ncbi:aminotransferase class III-fold pyridoxal phosphate-dependent enzyme [Streptomyces griseoloalbus]|uniref:aspartate aminotransferase family protein n=1 Tax=Streptomyces griseoloalbus TaxID=67303 RepID=UPI0033ADEBEF
MAVYEGWFQRNCPNSWTSAREAAAVMPGGLQHSLPPSAPFPVQMARTSGAFAWDVDGNQYTDFIQAGGASVLGANHPVVREAVTDLLTSCAPSTCFPHEAEIQLAQFVQDSVPSVERFRMLGSGTEAVMAAIRVARAFTGAAHIIKAGGAYHGWSDQLVFGLGAPGTAGAAAGGIPNPVLSLTHEVLPNDVGALRATLSQCAADGGTAAVLLEPLGPQSGTMPVEEGYAAQVRDLCDEFGALLVFDEVVSAFRLGMAGVQGHLGVRPDLTVFGKCIAGSYPGAGGLGGRADVMSVVTPGHTGTVAMLGGTLSAGPLSSVAGLACLMEMRRTDAPAAASRAGDLLCARLTELITKFELPFLVYNVGSIVHLDTSGLFRLRRDKPDYAEQFKLRRAQNRDIAMACAAEGVMISQTGRMFTCAAMTSDVIDDAVHRFEKVFAAAAAQ